jgi:1-deoxy-D-xylulose-5-phosphate synthase
VEHSPALFPDQTIDHGHALTNAGLELFSEKAITTPVVRIGWPDQFIKHATTQDELRRKYGLTVDATIARVKAQFGEARSVLKLVEAV